MFQMVGEKLQLLPLQMKHYTNIVKNSLLNIKHRLTNISFAQKAKIETQKTKKFYEHS